MTNVVTIIPARGGSKNIKNKNLKIFNGKPLIYWTILQAKKTKHCNKIYVSSDDEKILNYAKKLECIAIKRPKTLSSDNSSSEEAIKHTINNIKDTKIDYIVFLQCTSPLRSASDIDNALNMIIKKKANSLFSIVDFDDLTLWTYKNNKIIPFSYNPLKRLPRQKSENFLIENGSIYIFKPSVLRNRNNRIDINSFATYKMNKLKLFEIDDKDDFSLCEKIFKKLKLNL